MPHKVLPPSPQPSSRSIEIQAVVPQCFCEKQLRGSSCFAKLPAHIQALMNEHYESAGKASGDECACADSLQLFERFSELPANVQNRIIRFCMPSGQMRYLENGPASDEDSNSNSALLRCPPPAAHVNRLFCKYFKAQWKLTTIGTEASDASQSKPMLSYINFATDKLIIDINRPLSSLRKATHLVQHGSSQRAGPLPLHINETWAHAKAETKIPSLPALFFTRLSHLNTYWLVISDLGIAAAIQNGSAAPECRCVFSPMIKCLSVSSIPSKRHAFRYHVATGRVTCAEMCRDDEELDELLMACGEKNPDFATRVTFVHGGEDELLDTVDGLDWWHLPAWGLLNFKYEKLKKRLDWGLVTDVLQQQAFN